MSRYHLPDAKIDKLLAELDDGSHRSKAEVWRYDMIALLTEVKERRADPDATDKALTAAGIPLRNDRLQEMDSTNAARVELLAARRDMLAKGGRQALASAGIVVTTHPRDWAADRSDAWLYGIIVGWEGNPESRIAGEGDASAALREIAAKFGWSEEHVERLRSLRRAVEAIIEAGNHDRSARRLARARDTQDDNE